MTRYKENIIIKPSVNKFRSKIPILTINRRKNIIFLAIYTHSLVKKKAYYTSCCQYW